MPPTEAVDQPLRTEADIEKIASQVPLRRLAVPEDHAQAMLFLASDAASYVSGTVLLADGGWCAP